MGTESLVSNPESVIKWLMDRPSEGFAKESTLFNQRRKFSAP